MSIRRITDTDTPEVVASDDIVIYQRTDGAPLNWNTGASPAPSAEKAIRVLNETNLPFKLTMPIVSQQFWEGGVGPQPELLVPAFGTITLMFDGQFPWFVMARG